MKLLTYTILVSIILNVGCSRQEESKGTIAVLNAQKLERIENTKRRDGVTLNKDDLKRRIPLDIYRYYRAVNAKATLVRSDNLSLIALLKHYDYTETQIETAEKQYKLQDVTRDNIYWALPIETIYDFQFVPPNRVWEVYLKYDLKKPLEMNIVTLRKQLVAKIERAHEGVIKTQLVEELDRFKQKFAIE